MKSILAIIALILVSSHTFSQVAISYFPFQSILAMSTNTEKLFWADYKLETNTFASNMNMELSPKINVKRTGNVNYYVGPGVNFNPAYSFANLTMVNGYFVDLGVRVKPLEKHKNFQVVFEISPYANFEFGNGGIRTRFGVAWNFNKKDEGQQKP
jgi:hypothetical protein